MRYLYDKAYAKLNLYLRVDRARTDGYHDLTTVFQSVALHDELSVALHNRGGISLRCNLPWLPTDSRNLAVRAAECFFETSGISNQGLYLNIRKNIPVGAGMAGGSTDAAAVLRTLNRAYGAPLSKEELSAIALTLGADVPFCLTGGTALAKGVGEQLRPIPAMPTCPIVICKPPFSVSTKAAFERFDAFPHQDAPDEQAMCTALRSADLKKITAALYNSLEAPVETARPVIRDIRLRLIRLGAQNARMTGSGAAVFSFFSNEKAAKHAYETLKKQYTETYLTKPGGAL